MKRMLTLCVILAMGMMLAATVAGAAEDGKVLFESKCAMCHGKDGVAKSMAKGSGNFNDPKWQQATSQDAIEKTVTDGKNKMKGFKDKLTPEQIKAVASYIKSLK